LLQGKAAGDKPQSRSRIAATRRWGVSAEKFEIFRDSELGLEISVLGKLLLIVLGGVKKSRM